VEDFAGRFTTGSMKLGAAARREGQGYKRGGYESLIDP
jgi:hypothetical protein